MRPRALLSTVAAGLTGALAAGQVTLHNPVIAAGGSATPAGDLIVLGEAAIGAAAGGGLAAELGAVPCWLGGDAPAPCPGDADGSGAVGLDDLLILLGGFGTCDGDPGFPPGADFDTNGCVDLDDLLVTLGAFGTLCP